MPLPASGVTTRVEQFGRYTLFGKIAAGGMASVYLARPNDEQDGWYAIKRVHPHLASRPDVLQMFMNEAAILSRLDHPNICGITDYGIHEDTPFLVMRHLHGAPLSGLLRRILDREEPIPIDLMAYVVAGTCDGLHYAHDATREDGTPLGLVHRDISPQNIYVTFAGTVKLLDFGVAKAAGFTSFTRTGHIKGKYAYMSPEQVEAMPLDRRSDVFSLGIVLWEMMTGRHLFKRKREIDTLRAITRAAVPAASEVNPNVPQALDAIVARALVADKSRRFQSAKAMSEALWGYLTAATNPTGSDEVAEIMLATFPDAPTPEKVAQVNTQPDGVALDGTDPVEVVQPASEELVFDDATPRRDAASEREASVPWATGMGAPARAGDDPTVPIVAKQFVAPDDEPLKTDPDGLRSTDDDSLQDDSLQDSTLADPDLAEQVRAAISDVAGDATHRLPAEREALDETPFDLDDDAPAEETPLLDSKDYDDLTVRQEQLRARPAVGWVDDPHVDDPIRLEPFGTDANDTLTEDRAEESFVPTSAMVVTTVPRQEISEVPVEPVSDGPMIEDPPPSVLDGVAPPVPRTRTWAWMLIAVAVVLGSAALAYWLVANDSPEVIEVRAPGATGAPSARGAVGS